MLEEDVDDTAPVEAPSEKTSEAEEATLPDNISEEMPGDYSWEDVYDGRNKPKSGADDMPPLIDRISDSTADSLQAY